MVGSDPGAVQFISLCLQYLFTNKMFSDSIISLWINNLNEFTIKSAVEDGMLVEFSDIEDRDNLRPVTSNLTVETLPNDNLLFAGEITTTLTFSIKSSRPVKDDLIIK